MAFLRQLAALMWKNLLVIVLRHPVGFLLQFYAVPLVVFSILAQLPVWVLPAEHAFRTELPAAIPSSPSIAGTIAVVAPPNAAADIHAVIDRLAAAVAPDRPPLLRLDRETDLLTRCGATPADDDDDDDCHVAVIFRDSPGTGRAWNYTIRSDVPVTGAHRGSLETVYMPLQRAINAAITNTSSSASSAVEAFAFGPTWSPDADAARRGTLHIIKNVYAFVLFGCHLVAVYALAGWVSSDRDAGVSALLDSMGGGASRWTLPLARTLAWVAVLDVACLPLFVAFGALYQRLLFPASGVAALIGWQVLLGTALNSSAVFAAAFFTRARVSAIVVGVFALALAVAFQFHASRLPALPAPDTVVGLSAVFPSCSYMLYLLDMVRWEEMGEAARISSLPPSLATPDTPDEMPDLYHVTQSTLLGILAVQTVVYLGLAVVVEYLMHGIHFKGRHFSGADEVGSSSTAAAAVSATNLQKTFRPGFWTRSFSCRSDRKQTNRAVDDVSIDAHRGQIMCLVGPNGSGKTTTLHMLGGFLGMDGGTGRVSFAAGPSGVGVCPQSNVLWEELTVREHLVLWSGVKGTPATPERLDALIADCDLARKSGCPARHLSGGQQRKLQLACMLVGDPTVCLVDECTSGLDPLSRQAIWDLLLRSRAAGRSIVLTTHFLDEVDVLADHIVVLQAGQVRAQGSPAELSATHGGGHRVVVERTPGSLAVEAELQEDKAVIWQDRLVYRAQDSGNAAKLARTFAAAGVHDIAVAGPQFEDVFLNLAGDRGDPALAKSTTTAAAESDGQGNHRSPMEPGRETSFATQVRVLFRKRFQVLPRVWWAQLLAAAIVIAASCGLLNSTRTTVVWDCSEYVPRLVPAQTSRLQYDAACARGELTSTCDKLTVGPASANATVFEALRRGYPDFDGVVAAPGFVNVFGDRRSWLEYLQQQTGYLDKGIFFGTGGAEDPVVIAYQYQAFTSEATAAKLLNIWSQATANIEIATTYGGLPRIPKNTQDGTWTLVLFIALVQAAYPAFFVVYPAIERYSNVGSLQYANGVRRTPQMVAYMLFDLLWIAILSVVSTIAIVPILGWTGSPFLMILIFALHAVCANFIAQIVSHISNGPLKAFLVALTANLVCFAIGFGSVFGSLSQPDKVINGVTWGLGFFLPMANLVRALFVGFNAGGTGCTDGVAKMMGAMDAYGGPILYLILQIVWLGILSVWVDGGLPNISLPSILTRKQPAAASSSSTELQDLLATRQSELDDDVRAETTRALRTDTDPLRVLNVTKRFGANIAVDDVTFGLGSGEVLALLGPNGAGKSTLVNMIQSELRPTHGTILLGGSSGGGGAQAGLSLGVCPQHDGLDLLSTRQHLMLYARVKGVRDARGAVTRLMDRLGLAPHARTSAARLSGGNKRKLSLAIALLGAPPVLVLDEPTTAMDALSKRAFWRLVEDLAGGHSVLLTTHSMEEAERLAGRTAIMAAGRVLAVGSTARLRQRHGGGHSVCVALRSAPDSSPEEMAAVWAWARERAAAEGAEVKLERDMLRGQIRFTLAPAAAGGEEDGEDGAAKGPRLPPAIALWTLLEENKNELGIAFYSIGDATLANAFMNVVRANNVREENSESQKKSIGQRIRNLL